MDFLATRFLGRKGVPGALRRTALAVSVTFDLGMLAIFKYSSFIATNLDNALQFGNDPQKYFPSATIKCMHFHGTQVTKPIPSYHIYEGNLFDMIDDAVDFILSKIDCTIISSETKVQGKSVYEIPAKVVKEAIVNGCAHRDYTSNGSVQVMLFKDRLEVLSPGELPDKISISQLSRMHESVPVNPLIANPLYLTRYAENAGSGTTDMIELCRKAGLPSPEYVQETGCFHTIIKRHIDYGNRLVSGMFGENGTENGTENGRKVKIGAGKVLDYVIKHPGCQTPEMEKALGIPLRTLRRYLQVLKEDCIEHRGAYTNGGYYVKKSPQLKVDNG
ncbi:MAG: hypothetical protein MJ025_03310 [Victivallaceae bacterium]|nr:hypothetical protein [Victivallaceae bacterium]